MPSAHPEATARGEEALGSREPPGERGPTAPGLRALQVPLRDGPPQGRAAGTGLEASERPRSREEAPGAAPRRRPGVVLASQPRPLLLAPLLPATRPVFSLLVSAAGFGLVSAQTDLQSEQREEERAHEETRAPV